MEAHESARPAPQWRSNVAALATEAARARPDAEAVVDRRRRVAWAGLARESGSLAAGLGRLGAVAGQRVAILLPNRVEFVTGYLGAMAAGMAAVPMNPGAPTGEVVRVLADSNARVVICDGATVTTARTAVAGLADALEGADEALRARAVVPQLVVVDAPTLPGEQSYAELAAGPESTTPSPQDPETLAALLYTAGAGGRPRAAMLPHRALLANIEQAAALSPAPLTADDRVLGALPLFHVYGLNAVLGQVLRQHACLVLTERFDPHETLRLVGVESLTNLPVAPPAVAAWADREDLRARLAGVRTVLSGASALSPEAARRFEQRSGVAVHQGYGLTEAAPVVATTLALTGPRKRGSVGRPLPGVEVRIVDEHGRDVDDCDPGEIWLRGDNLFRGYWPGGEGGPDADGWFATGDLGYLDPDGELFLVDRLGDRIVVSGFNVYPVEVEEAIREVPGVKDVAVVGTPHPDNGERVVAYVVADRLSGVLPERLVADVRAHCSARLAPFKRPMDVHVVDELPRLVGGRIARARLRDHERRRAMGLA